VARIVPEQPVGCKDLKNDKEEFVAFKQNGSLADVVALPARVATSSWWAEHTDQSRIAVSTSSKVESTSSSAAATTTTTPITLPTHAHLKKTATTIGLAVGLGVDIPLLLIIVALTFFCLRRQRKNKNNTTLNPDPTTNPDIASPHTMPPAYDYPGEKKDVAASHAHVKAELDGTPNIGSPGPSEMQDTSVVGSPYGSPIGSPKTVYDGFQGPDEIRKAERGAKTGVQAHEMAG
jgi:hypothetical protein